MLPRPDPCQNRLKTRLRWSAAIPLPWSAMSRSTPTEVALGRQVSLGAVARALCGEADHPFAVPERVLDEVGQDLVETVGVGPHLGKVLGDFDGEAVALLAARDRTLDMSRVDGADVDGQRPDLQPPGVDPGHVEQLGDQPGDPVGVRLDRLEHEPLLVVAEPVPSAQQGRGEALHRGQRRPQLVGDRRDDGGVLGLGAPAVQRVAHQDVDPVHRLVASRSEVLGGDQDLAAVVPQHEQLLAVARADPQPAPGVRDGPPGGAVAVLQVDRLADVGTDQLVRRTSEDARGATVEEQDPAFAVSGDQAVRDQLRGAPGGLVVHQLPGREVHGADLNGCVLPRRRRGRPWRPWRG